METLSSLSVSLSACIFAYSPISFPLFFHTVENRTRTSPSLDISQPPLAPSERESERTAHTVYTRVRESTRAFGNVSVHRRSKVSDRVCRDPRRYGVGRRERTRFSRVYAGELCSPRALSRIPEEEPAAPPCY